MANLDSIARLAEVDGVLPVDKPSGIAAHDVMKALKTNFNLVKVGHGGTLEAAASGLFLVLLGDATRLSGGLMSDDRLWEARLRLGVSTETFDREGRVVAEKPVAGVDEAALAAALKELRGDIYQAPPAFTAVKLPHRPGYEIMRTAEGDALRERLVHVFRIAVKEFAPPFLSLEILCTKNTNIRSLCNSLGGLLGCGAYVEEQRRTGCGKFSVGEAVPFMEILKGDSVALREKVVPLEKMFAH